jgi:Antitoxin-like ribbon-helix-helix
MPVAVPRKAPSATAAVSSAGSKERPDRHGQRLFSGYVDAETLRAVKTLTAKQDTTNIALMREAIALVLDRHSEPIPKSVIEHCEQNQRLLPGPSKAKGHGHKPT